MTGRDRAATVAVAVVAVSAVVLVGSALRWTQAIVALLVAAAVATQLGSRRTFLRRQPLLLLLGAAATWTAIQLVPLPGGIVEALTPTLDGYRSDGAVLAKIDVASTLTMDGAGTLRALSFLVTLLGLAFVGLRVATMERGRYWLVATVVGTAGITCGIVWIHELLGASSLYGLYEPRQASPPVLGPLLNSNHLGCYTATGAVASIGLVFYPKQPSRRRALWAFVGLACVATTLATLSRGAIIALGIGTFVAAATLIAQRFHTSDAKPQKRRERLLSRTLPLGILVVCGLIIAAYVSAGSVRQQFARTSLQEISDPHSKFAAWRSSFALIEDSPWTGVGRGAFESTFTRVHPGSSQVTFSHLENEALQAVVEWGIPATIVLATLAMWVLLVAIRRWRDGPLAAGVLGALIVVAFQSNFDFGIELLGIAAPVTILVATLVYVPVGEAPERIRPARARRIALLVLLVAGGVALFHRSTKTLDEDHELRKESEIREALERHPLDYLGYAALAEQELRAHDSAGVRLLNHALRLHPTHAGLHRLAARLLLRAGRSEQAELEYAAAMRGLRDPNPVIDEVLRFMPMPNVVRAIPTTLDIDATVRTLQQHGRGDVAELWLERVHANRRDLHSIETLYSLALERDDLEIAERAGRARCEIITTNVCRLALAQVLVRAKKHAELIELLHDVPDWYGYADQKVAAWLLLCDSFAGAGKTDDARYCLRRLEGSGLVKPDNEDVQRRLEAWSAKPANEPSKGI